MDDYDEQKYDISWKQSWRNMGATNKIQWAVVLAGALSVPYAILRYLMHPICN